MSADQTLANSVQGIPTEDAQEKLKVGLALLSRASTPSERLACADRVEVFEEGMRSVGAGMYFITQEHRDKLLDTIHEKWDDLSKIMSADTATPAKEKSALVKKHQIFYDDAKLAHENATMFANAQTSGSDVVKKHRRKI